MTPQTTTPAATLHVVWPEHPQPATSPNSAEEAFTSITDFTPLEQDGDYVPSKWEERFSMSEIQALLFMLEHLTQGLPGAVRRMLLRRADQFPKLHGRFAPHLGRLSFHADDSFEVVCIPEHYVVHANGERERMW